MAGLTLTNADAALKEDYQPAMREQLNNKFMLLAQIEKNTKDVEGRRAILSLHTKRNSGVGARREGGPLPTAGSQGYTEERVPLRYNYGRIQINGPVIRAMKSDNGSFVRAVESETKGVVTDLKRDVNRQLFGTSNGVIATGASSAGQVITLAAATTEVQLRQIEVGMVIDVGTVANPVLKAAAVEVSAVNTAAKTVTVIGTLGAVAGTDFIFRSGAGGSGANQQELTGLQSIVAATGTLFNVDPTVTPVWASTVSSNGGTPRNATENVFAKALQQADIAGSPGVDLFVTSDGVHRGYNAQLASMKRIVNTLDLKGGYKGLAISAGSDGEVPLTWDRDAPNGLAFGLSSAHLFQHEASDWEFMDEDGAVLSRVSGVDAYEATLFKYHELTTDQRNAHILVSDLAEV